jgi:PKD repeat protein
MSPTLLGRRVLIAAALTIATALGASAPAGASHPQPTRNIAHLPYNPISEFEHGDDIPEPDEAEAFFTAPGRMDGITYPGPEGSYNAYDTNVFETLMLPFRAAGDTTTNDEYGNNDPRHGFCEVATPAEQQEQRPGNLLLAAGICPNHALEYANYYEATMQKILGEFGVTMHRYEFTVPEPQLGSAPPDNTLGGKAYNLAAVVPGADHPDESVIIGAHYDQTNDGPASTWDSAEGHAQIIRVAKQMADYWKATGTRPSATIKFIPWAGEEAGTLGSRDYTEKNIVPGDEEKVRGYWNTDPCAGGYPAYYNGTPDRIPVGIQLARVEEIPDEFGKGRARVTAFNNKAQQVVEDFFNKVDDTVKVGAVDHPRPIFVSTAEAEAGEADPLGGSDVNHEEGVKIGDSRPELFSSDWANFLNKGVPFFNPGPEVTGPSDEEEPNYPEGLATFHTPNDNQVTLNRLTGQPLSQANDAVASEGWAKGMEMCASFLSWGMLREDQAGAQTADDKVVAYYEALPNEAQVRAPVKFDASGSHQLQTVMGTRTSVPDELFDYLWDFGDGSTGTGKVVSHTYTDPGIYQSTLTVRRKANPNLSDTMTIPISVVGADLKGPELTAPGEDVDGFFDLSWKFDQKSAPNFLRYLVEEATNLRRAFTDAAENMNNWRASEPTTPEIDGWQQSDADNGSVRGNIHHSGDRGFYTGVSETDQRPGQGPNSGVSKLTLKEPIQLAKDAELSYWSSFSNDLNDRGRVEAAIATGDPDDELDWVTVDRLTTGEEGDDAFYTPGLDDSPATPYPTDMKLRRADLGAFANQKVKLRFVYALGTAQYVNVFRTGWYVDDIQVDTGTFRPIGEPTAATLKINGRPKGLYSYRVRGIFADTASRTSNFASTNVTVGTDPVVPPKPPIFRGPVPPPDEGQPCTVRSGFKSFKVKRRKGGRGLRFVFSRRVNRKVNLTVFRYVRGKGSRIGRKAVKRFKGKTRSFNWNGRGKRIRNGAYYVRASIPTPRGSDVRYFNAIRSKGRFRVRGTFIGRPKCGPLRLFRLAQMVFGGKRKQALGVIYQVRQAGTVRIQVLRGKKAVARKTRTLPKAGKYRTRFKPTKRLRRRGSYRVRIIGQFGGQRVVRTVSAYRI